MGGVLRGGGVHPGQAAALVFGEVGVCLVWCGEGEPRIFRVFPRVLRAARDVALELESAGKDGQSAPPPKKKNYSQVE